MDTEFWQNAWDKSDEPGWQQKSPNALMKSYWASCGAMAGESVFIPLCGRSPDISWLLDFGHHIIGVDLAGAALEQFCSESGLAVTTEEHGEFTVYKAPRLTLYAGDFFSLPAGALGDVSRVYDRASIVAMPPHMRQRYVSKLRSLTPTDAEIFTIAMTYDQKKMKGPPFSVDDAELQSFFADGYEIAVLGREIGDMRRRGLDYLEETAYRLLPKVRNET